MTGRGFMLFALKAHPDDGSADTDTMSVTVEAAPALSGRLDLRFTATGEIARLRLPAKTAPTRADNLWRASCFEAFLAPDDAGAYYEFNFSPSTQWAAYQFAAYRSGMGDAALDGAPVIKTALEDTRFILQAVIALTALPPPADGYWRLGLSAILERDDGARSHWALTHPPGAPDFHHADCFAAQIPARNAP